MEDGTDRAACFRSRIGTDSASRAPKDDKGKTQVTTDIMGTL